MRQPATMSGPRSRELDHRRDVARIVLQVAVGGHDEAAARVGEAGGKRRGLPEVAAEADHAQPGVPRLQRRQRVERVVGAAVVDDEDLVGAAERLEHVVSSR